MKLISLNIWEGGVLEPLKKFIKHHSNDTDIFCFQEVLKNDELNLLNEIQILLPDFVVYFTEQVPGVGLATFIRNNIKVKKMNPFLILSTEEILSSKIAYPYPRMMQTIALENSKITICNFHGVPGNEKRDTKERELQTKRLQGILGDINGHKILVGDFNLAPDTEAISILEKQMKNLIKGSSFKTTRSSYYEKRESMPFADYAFVSSDFKIKKFEILNDEVSDHLPILLEF